jgi:hypothetical protein
MSPGGGLRPHAIRDFHSGVQRCGSIRPHNHGLRPLRKLLRPSSYSLSYVPDPFCFFRLAQLLLTRVLWANQSESLIDSIDLEKLTSDVKNGVIRFDERHRVAMTLANDQTIGFCPS